MNNENIKETGLFSRDALKYFAAFFMFTAHYFALMKTGLTENGSQQLWVQAVCALGIIAPPIFFFMAAEGCHYTRSKKDYCRRLLIFSVITQIPETFFFHEDNGWRHTNVMFTILFGVLAAAAWDSGYKKKARIALIALCCGATALIGSDWQVFGVLYIFFLYIFREQPKKRLTAYAAISAVHVLLYFIMMPFSIQIPILIFDFTAAYFLVTRCCSGKKGRFPVFSKWFFYVFFPAHYLLIGVSRLFIG